MSTTKKSILETGDRLLKLLEHFTEEKPEWGVAELSKELELNKSIIHRMLVTLENRNFLKQNLETKKYSLGVKLFELGMIVSRQMNLLDVSKSTINDLAEKTGETVLLEVVSDQESLCVGIKESKQGLKCTSRLGARVPLYAGAPTKVLMAHLTEAEVDNVIKTGLKKFTENTITDPDKLKKQLKAIRKKGYSVTYGELDLGSLAISFPVRNYKGEVAASISLVGPEFRMEEKLDQYIRFCKEAANSISKELGYTAVKKSHVL
ncbi:IclR family transcriptional regulator [Lentibacillus populi]|uniref:IclR family transcriptional regulator n=1 Tax=Lentibacillus populi TaxID=1827502 RepID=A0A9W5TX65_9BACI|nr:IclR family transcriptional regulator [Lentibacillus populi]GGB39081.1 IclR family transcriptional regulator [Lentibacillus populi]